MRRSKKAPTRRGSASKPKPPSSTSNGNTPSAAAQPATYVGECVVCGAASGHFTLTVHPSKGPSGTLMFCYKCGRDWDVPYARRLAEELEISLGELLAHPLRHLEPWLDSAAEPVRRKPAGRLPPEIALRRAVERLRGDETAMRHIVGVRGLTRLTVRSYGLGFAAGEYWFPVRHRGRLVNLVRHVPGDDPPYRARSGQDTASLYPNMPSGQAVLLVAGIFDALLARQHGLPAVTTTCGKTLPDHLAVRFKGKRVAVAYDSGEEEAAYASVKKLRAVGVSSAWVVSLPLPEGGDVADWFVKFNNTKEELVAQITAAREAK